MEDLLGLLLGFVPCGWGDEVREEAELTIGDSWRQRYKRHHTAAQHRAQAAPAVSALPNSRRETW